jgi:hypothetical protein
MHITDYSDWENKISNVIKLLKYVFNLACETFLLSVLTIKKLV